MTIRISRPLPECRLCDRPVRRATYLRTGGLCTDCDNGIAETVRLLPVARRLPPAPDDLTVYVEHYTPPVPRGQLRLVDDDAGATP